MLAALGCGDDGATQSDTIEAPGSSRASFDGGAATRDGGRDAGVRDAGRIFVGDATTTVVVDAGKAGVVTFARTDGCPADAPLAVDRVRVYPGPGGAAALAGVQFEGSNEGTTVGFEVLGKLDTAPSEGAYTELSFPNTTLYRYIRFVDPTGRLAPLAEVEFYHGQLKLTGEGFGTVGSSDHPYSAALDGDPSTYFEGETAGGNYVGLDVAGTYVAQPPSFAPTPGALTSPTTVSLATSTPGAVIHFTTDGTTPTADSPSFTKPIAVGMAKLTIRALSTAACYFSSAVVSGTYGIAGQAVAVGQKSYHLGNSLTDVIDGFLEPIADSTGVTHTFSRWTIPGCQISWQADPAHTDQGTAIPDQARNVSSFVKSFLPDHMSVQPFTDPTIANEGPAALTFLRPAVAANPAMQAWIYAQWPSTDPTKPDTAGRGYLQDELARGASWANWPAPAAPVPNTWEDTTEARMRYYEAFADFVDARLDGKPVLIIPGGPALATFKRRVDAGRFPGITDFFAQVFGDNDDLHLRNNGRYLVGLVFYACMYRKNPSDVVTWAPDDVTAEQAAALREIAWETASGYPRCGIAD